ncbi:MAG: hypothetical protein IJ794_03505 [Lachnospiraceae bacterium]|nr:hypothetical protein [Lachnospiraceae bacterium]
MRKLLTLILFLFLTFCILTNPALSLSFAGNGLVLWYDKMIPALLPFMILSGTLIRMGLTEGFTTLVYPLVGPIYRVSRNVCYVMLMGFMCGFPMGAKCVSDLYLRGGLTKREAAYLLAFCNNIGPVYFVSFALPVIGCNKLVLPLLGMYGLPLLYGFFLRYTSYCDLDYCKLIHYDGSIESAQNVRTMHSAQNSQPLQHMQNSQSLLPALDEAIHASIQSMLMLGGYMILFNLLMLVPYLYGKRWFPYLAPILEITGGLAVLENSLPIYSLILLPFGGLSCIAQTYTCMKDTDLPLWDYVQHKLLLTAITACYYLFLRFLRLL